MRESKDVVLISTQDRRQLGHQGLFLQVNKCLGLQKSENPQARATIKMGKSIPLWMSKSEANDSCSRQPCFAERGFKKQ